MIQEPNPADDPQLEIFCEWLFAWRNDSSANFASASFDKMRGYLREIDLRRIWLEGVARWHLAQISNGVIPPDLYAYHSAELRKTYAELEAMPDFVPTYTMR